MNKYTALQKLKETRELSTDLLEALDTSFERFLRIAQFDDKRRSGYIEKLIKREEQKVQARINALSLASFDQSKRS